MLTKILEGITPITSAVLLLSNDYYSSHDFVPKSVFYCKAYVAVEAR